MSSPPVRSDASAALARLTQANQAFAQAFPGDRADRQPVHTVYGGAHLFTASVAQKLGEAALASLAEYAPDPASFASAVGLDPSLAPAVYARALQPVPRPLADATREWSTREIYWITRNGIKMSGMPAWRGHLDEAQTWAVVAFVARLATLSPADYRAFAGGRCTTGAQHAASQSSSAALAGATDAQESAPVDPAQARQLLRQYGCHACHAIPGLSGPARLLGPPLAGLGRRTTIAGRLPNDAATLRAWIQHPQRLDPLSAMPELEVSDADAHVIAAWLATLR